MTIAEISVQDAHRGLDGYEIFDVRSDGEFEGPLGRIEGSRLLPLPELEDRADELPRGRRLLLVCRSGRRSARACEWIQEQGLGDATNLVGGMIAWNRAGLPVARTQFADAKTLLESIADWYGHTARQDPDAARATLDGLLRRSGASADAPTRSSLERMLSLLADRFRKESPEDLDLALAAFRRAVGVL